MGTGIDAMSARDVANTIELSFSERDHLDQACDRFEIAWKTQGSVRIEDYLAEATEAERGVLLRELLILELSYRRRQGEHPAPREYLDRFPCPAGIETVIAAFVLDSSAPPRFTRFENHDRGGLGRVFTAFDTELNRQVAVKRIRDELARDPQSRTRFLREAEITGQLEHPGIVPVYSLNRSDADRLYYAMQFIRGETLKSAIKRFHSTAGERRDPWARSLALRGLLQRFINVCNTVDYAHSRGILHRDLKPDNVMLGRFGETFVLDWGLAKPIASVPDPCAAEPPITPASSGDSSQTQPGSCIGTPQYMSPEQAAGQHDHLDTASDVYSLGATLYHLLVGNSPFAPDSDVAVVLEKAKAAAFAPPRSLRAEIPRPLEAICMKAMARRAPDRYQTARALADDIEHWLADQPVTALPDSPANRILRSMRRHRAATQATVALLIITTVVSSAWAVRVEQARGGERLARQRADTALVAAEARGQLAIDALKMFRTAVESNQDLKGREDLRPLLGAFLKEPLEFFATLRDQLQSSRDTGQKSLDRLAHASLDLGVTLQELGNRADALRAYREALAVWEPLADTYPSSTELQNDLAAGYFKLGSLNRELGQPDEALALHRRSLAIQEKLARNQPATFQSQNQFAESHDAIAVVLQESGRQSDALDSYLKAMTVLQRLAATNPTDAHIQRQLAWVLMHAGSMRAHLGQDPAALKFYETALVRLERLARANPAGTWDWRDVAVAHSGVGTVEHSMGRLKDSLRSHEKALELRDRLVRENPSVNQFRTELAESLHLIGEHHQETGSSQAALAAHQKALEIRERLARENPAKAQYQSDLAQSCYLVAELHRASANRQEALSWHRKALEIRERLAREDPGSARLQSEIGWNLMRIGGLLGEINQPREAIDCYFKALPIQQRLAQQDPSRRWFHRDVGVNYTGAGVVYQSMGSLTEALEAHKNALVIRERLVRDNPAISQFHVELAWTYSSIGDVCRQMGRFADALEFHRKAPPIWERLAREGVSRPDLQQSLVSTREEVAKSERLLEHDVTLTKILKGTARPQNPDEAIALAEFSATNSLYGAAAYFYAEAFAAMPERTDSLQSDRRYAAACAAAEAGRGDGKDVPPLDDSARASARARSREWLRYELAGLDKLLKAGLPPVSIHVTSTLQRWKTDRRLAGLRDDAELVRLPLDEQRACRALWADVDRFIVKASMFLPPAPGRGSVPNPGEPPR
jgi:eukaryotic-like serine/threonine-protein kinase